MASTRCSLLALVARTTARFGVEIDGQTEYEDDQTEQGAEHDELAHNHVPPESTTDLIIVDTILRFWSRTWLS